MIYARGVLSGIAGLFLAGLICMFGTTFRGISAQKATGLSAVVGGFLECIFSPLFWVLALLFIVAFFAGSRLANQATRILFFWVPTLLISIVGLGFATSFMIVYLHLKDLPPHADELDDAVRLLWSGKTDQGLSAIRSMAEKSNVKAQLFLGHGYAQESAIARQADYSEAMKWFKRASTQGSGEGSAAVAELFEQGFGVTKSSEEAKAWWELAAKQGYDQQELDVRCFTRTADTERLTCKPWSNGSGCPTDAEMETLRASGVTGILKPTGGGGGRFRFGPKARALIVLDHRIASEERLKQPRHTNIIYVQHETDWVLLPTNAPLLDRPIVLSPQRDAPQFTMAGVQDVDGSTSAGGCAAWK